MKKILLSLALVVLPFLGLLDSGYVSYNQIVGTLPVCHPPFQCAAVLKSPWINIGHFPIFFLGFTFFSIFLFFAILHYLGVNINLGKKKILTSNILFGLGLIAIGFAVYILILMALIIKAWCLYCLLSATTCSLIFVASFINWKLEPRAVHF